MPRSLFHPSIRVFLRTSLLLGAAGLAAGCGNSSRAVTQVEVPLPAQVLATQPAARSTGVLYDTPISVDFATDMDAASLTTSTVFLKLDTQRLPIQLSWDAGARRLRVIPQGVLQLRRTYTVELTSGVRTAEGSGFGSSGWFFQFTTNGARRPDHAYPGASGEYESPFTMLAWDSTEASAGSMRYQVWAGADSAAIALRSGTALVEVTRASWFPTTPWPLGTRMYWAITVVNGTTGEHHDGPVRSFETLPAGSPIDSVSILAEDFGFNQIGAMSSTAPAQTCSADSVATHFNIQGWFHFPLGALPADARIAHARIELHTFDHYVARLPLAVLATYSSKIQWPLPCQAGLQFREALPIRDQLLASGVQESGRRVLFLSTPLASHVEAAVRRGGFFGYEFGSAQRVAWVTPRHFDTSRHPYLKIHYFRTAPAPRTAIAP